MAKKTLIVAAVALAALGGGGFFAYTKFFSAPPPVEEPVPVAQPKVTLGPLYPMDPFLSNLAEPGRPRFLKLAVQLELDGDPVAAELDSLKPKVRDSLLTLLASKSSADLLTVADKERLRNEILHRLNSFLGTGRVVEVYFTEFVVQ